MGMLGQPDGTYVDSAAHRLYHAGRAFLCDRNVEALQVWNGHALLLSSDTDCLSLWDSDGLVRTTRVGVYPQDMAVSDNTAYVCGGADGMLHLLDLPSLQAVADYPLPGMPERVAFHGDAACLLTLLADYDVQTLLLRLDLRNGTYQELARYAGLPGAISTTETGLWVGVSETVLHIPHDSTEADFVIEGFGLPRRIETQGDSVLITDPLEGVITRVTQKPRPAVEVLYRGDVENHLFS